VPPPWAGSEHEAAPYETHADLWRIGQFTSYGVTPSNRPGRRGVVAGREAAAGAGGPSRGR